MFRQQFDRSSDAQFGQGLLTLQVPTLGQEPAHPQVAAAVAILGRNKI
jgi:hypothetical protein